MPLSKRSQRRATQRQYPEFSRPNLHWSRRMPLRSFAWDLGWWLILNVTMRDYTGPQRAAMVKSALGRFRQDPAVKTGTANATTVTWEPSDGTF